jgi:hypothetical protein
MQPLLLGRPAAKAAAVIRSLSRRLWLRHGDQPPSETTFGSQYLRQLSCPGDRGSQQLRGHERTSEVIGASSAEARFMIYINVTCH